MLKIKSIEFFNDEIFGNNKYDFTINGKVANTVILAGKNGCGKTKLLDYIYKILNMNMLFSSSLEESRVVLTLDISNCNYTCNEKNVDTAKIILKETTATTCQIEMYCSGEVCDYHSIKNNNENISHLIKLNALYSPVDINYTPINDVTSVSNKTLDNNDTSIPMDLASEITQLLVDIKNQDNNDLAKYFYDNPGKLPPKSIQDIRVKRFNNAFYHIFDKSLKFKELEKNITPVFQKGENRIKINDLSSGEKQIVFRGTYLLRNKEALNGTIVLIDEPEISMHPLWNRNIYSFYRRLFKTDNGTETSQLIMATHSEYVIASAIEDEKCLIIKMDSSNKKGINKTIKDGLIINSSAAIKYYVFDIPSIDYHIQLYSYIQNNYVGVSASIKKVDEFLIRNNSPSKYSYFNRHGNKMEYNSLCTYIRNCIDHPNEERTYTRKELKLSLKFMIKLIKQQNAKY